MTKEEVQKSLDEIKFLTYDPEAAHSREDALYHNFVVWIAETRSKKQKELANLLLTAQEIDFPRWCA